jgi:hypothetical protein
MVFKYRQKIVEAIFDTLIENYIDKNGLRRSDIYDKLIAKLRLTISDRDCSDHLCNLVKDGFLIRDDKHYFITDKFKESRQLGIFGIDDEEGIEKKRRLHQFLILCKCMYKAKSIPEKQLDNLLSYVNAKKEHLVVELRIHTNGTNFFEIVYKKISTIRVRLVELVEYGKRKFRRYYYEEDGFSQKEVTDHFKQRTRNCHLFVGNYNYAEEEIMQNVESLKSLDILRPIRSYDTKEPRYSVGEYKSIQKIKDAIWKIHNIEMYYLLQLKHELSDSEKEGLKLLFGGLGSNKLKKSAIFSMNLLPTTELKKLKKGTDAIIDRKIKEFYNEYQKPLQQSYLYSDLVTKLIIRDSPLNSVIGTTQSRRKRGIQGTP